MRFLRSKQTDLKVGCTVHRSWLEALDDAVACWVEEPLERADAGREGPRPTRPAGPAQPPGDIERRNQREVREPAAAEGGRRKAGSHDRHGRDRREGRPCGSVQRWSCSCRGERAWRRPLPCCRCACRVLFRASGLRYWHASATSEGVFRCENF
jgi:hypothetical protein